MSNFFGFSKTNQPNATEQTKEHATTTPEATTGAILAATLPDKRPTKKQSTAALQDLSAIFAGFSLEETRRPDVFRRLPAQIFDDVSGPAGPEEAEDLIVRLLVAGGPSSRQLVEDAVRAIVSRDSFSPPPRRTDEPRSTATVHSTAARQKIPPCPGCGEFRSQCVCSVLAHKKATASKKEPPQTQHNTENDDEEDEEEEADDTDEEDEEDEEEEQETTPPKAPKRNDTTTVDNPKFLLDGKFWPQLAESFSATDVERALSQYSGYALVFSTFPSDAAFLKDVLRQQFLLLKTGPPRDTQKHAISTIDRCISRLEFFAARKRSVVEGAAVEQELCDRTLPPHLRKARRAARKEAKEETPKKDKPQGGGGRRRGGGRRAEAQQRKNAQ